jgi:hypothetical protein
VFSVVERASVAGKGGRNEEFLWVGIFGSSYLVWLALIMERG